MDTTLSSFQWYSRIGRYLFLVFYIVVTINQSFGKMSVCSISVTFNSAHSCQNMMILLTPICICIFLHTQIRLTLGYLINNFLNPWERRILNFWIECYFSFQMFLYSMSSSSTMWFLFGLIGHMEFESCKKDNMQIKRKSWIYMLCKLTNSIRWKKLQEIIFEISISIQTHLNNYMAKEKKLWK